MTRVSVEPGTLIADVSQDPCRLPCRAQGAAVSCVHKVQGAVRTTHTASEEAWRLSRGPFLFSCSDTGSVLLRAPRTAPADTGRSEA